MCGIELLRNKLFRLEAVRRNARLEHADSSDDSDDDETAAAAAVAAAMAVGSRSGKHAEKTHLNKRLESRTDAQHNSNNTNNSNAAQNLTLASKSEHCYDIMRKFEQHQRVSFFKQNKKQFPMFPFQEEKSRVGFLGLFFLTNSNTEF